MMSLILAGMCVLGESTRDSCISRAKRGEVNVVLGLLRNQLLCLNSVSSLVVLYSHYMTFLLEFT